jgi:starch phosphorylase
MDIASELRGLARNLWWTWHPQVVSIFRDMDPELWRAVKHNPIRFLAIMEPAQIEQRAAELALEARINHAFHRQNEYVQNQRTWGGTHAGPLKRRPIVYFSAEFGIHESVPIYSGGLGTLAGDHLKSASDLGLPVIGVGLFYAQGYFSQRLDATGWQNERYFETEVAHLPVEEVMGTSGPLRIVVDTRDKHIALRIWRMPIGRCVLLLLDSDVDENEQEVREVTGRLYGGDATTRILQELILGVGGVRAVFELGTLPGVLHLNEGHSAFAVLELARQIMVQDAVGFNDAFARARHRTVFTTHTPVDAGHDRFDAKLMEEALGPAREALGLSQKDFMALGRVNENNAQETFCMTVLGLRGSRTSNAVSALHGRVSRRMWQGLWAGEVEDKVPIDHVTNGVHVSSWLATPMRELLDTYLGAGWPDRMSAPETWTAALDIDARELWEAHQILKARLVSYVQRQVCAQEATRDADGRACALTEARLDPNVLTIGFARRFATYKRHNLIFDDEKRLENIVLNKSRPVQMIFAGKAHPQDDPGKHMIQRIFQLSRDPRFLGRIVFLEDYDINVGRHLVQSVDLWLNTPRRPREASGTSGMKAVFNGVLNLSIVDGWWAEAYDGTNGFAVGVGGQHSNREEQDRRDAADLFSVLENEVLPLYYDRSGHDIPLGWVARIKNAMQTLGWRFNANRMVIEHARKSYFPIVGVCDKCSEV